MFGFPDHMQLTDENDKKEKHPGFSGSEDQKLPEGMRIGDSRVGNLLFFDAFSTQAPTIKEDILIGLEKAKVSGPIAKQLDAGDNELTPLKAGKKRLSKALSEHGIGAKTAIGYGFFQST